MASIKDQMEALWRGNKQPSPISKTLGFELVEYTDGGAFFTMVVSESHWSFVNSVHGGVLTSIAEAAMGVAFITTLNDGENFTMNEVHMYYLHKIKFGRIDARAKVIDRGRTLGMVECELRNEQNLLIAKASSTCMVLRRSPEKDDSPISPDKQSPEK